MKPIATLTLNPAVDKSADVRHVLAEDKLRCSRPRYEPGGGGLNVSRAIQKLGGASTAYYLAGGPTGAVLEKLLADEALPQVRLPIGGWTRENLIVREEVSGRQYRFGMPGPEVAEAEWKGCLSRLEALDPAPAYLVASGSLPPGVPEDAYARLARMAQRNGVRLLLDTSGAALRAAMREPVFLIKPNIAELAMLAGHPIEGEAELEGVAMELVAERRCRALLVSLGARGALLATADGPVRLYAPTVPIQSKVGAGDSMMGGAALALARGRPLVEAARYGVAAGTAAVITPGTELCRRADVERLYKQVHEGHAAEAT